MQSKKTQVARFLNLCDRVEVLSDIVHDESHVMDMKVFDPLMDQYYLCLDQFFQDIRRESQVVGIDASFQEKSATFTARFADDTTREFTYDKIDETI